MRSFSRVRPSKRAWTRLWHRRSDRPWTRTRQRLNREGSLPIVYRAHAPGHSARSLEIAEDSVAKDAESDRILSSKWLAKRTEVVGSQHFCRFGALNQGTHHFFDSLKLPKVEEAHLERCCVTDLVGSRWISKRDSAKRHDTSWNLGVNVILQA